MNLFDAIILGIIEGVTEYLPVSSTGHLILTQRLLGLPENAVNNAYAICIQGGAILAVLTLYKERFYQLVNGILGRDRLGLKLLLNLLIAFLPAAIIGILFNNIIEKYLFGLLPIITAWFIGGVVIFSIKKLDKRNKEEYEENKLEQLSYKQALIIGLCQCECFIM